MDELREQIWDYLFKAGSDRSVADIAAWAGRQPDEVRSVVTHPWFRVSGEQVGVA